MFKDLLRPFLYLTIHHPGKILWVINWLVPIVATGILFALIASTAPSVDFFSKDGLFSKLLGFIQSLPGFYLAALAAVATFGQDSLDKLMPGTPPTVNIIFGGRATNIQLTRRRFLSLMFSYLTALSFLLTLALIAATSFSAPIASLLNEHGATCWLLWIRWIAAFILVATTIQLLVVTFWGLYYLGERMHTPDN